MADAASRGRRHPSSSIRPPSKPARVLRRQKPRALADKLTTVADAVARLVHDGDYLAIGGFGGDRLPTAVVHEILRQGKQTSASPATPPRTTFRFSAPATSPAAARLWPGSISPTSSAWRRAGCRRTPAASWSRARSSSTSGRNYALAVRFKAAAMGVPFLPARVHARHRHLPPERRQDHRLPLHRRDAGRRCPPCSPTWPRSTFTRPTATATAASAARPSPTSTWPGPRSG